jgi:hypothetical protein
MESISVNTVNFNLMDFTLTLTIMLVFLSFLMEAVRFFITDIQDMVLPTSTTNETIKVMVNKVPGWAVKLLLTAAIIFTIVVVRGTLGLELSFGFTQSGYRVLFEMGMALGFLTVGYTIAGPLIARNLTMKLMKKYKFSGIDVITDEEYMTIGKNKQPAI